MPSEDEIRRYQREHPVSPVIQELLAGVPRMQFDPAAARRQFIALFQQETVSRVIARAEHRRQGGVAVRPGSPCTARSALAWRAYLCNTDRIHFNSEGAVPCENISTFTSTVSG